MLNLFKLYKNYILIGLFVLFSVGLWNVSAKYTETKYLKKQLDVQQAIIDTTEKNQITKNEVVRAMSETLANLKPKNTVINRTIQNEITKDTVYIDCKSSPSVMREYQRKLDQQPK